MKWEKKEKKTNGVSSPAKGEERLGLLARDTVLTVDPLPVIRLVNGAFSTNLLESLLARLQAGEKAVRSSEAREVVVAFRVDETVQRRGRKVFGEGSHLGGRRVGEDGRNELLLLLLEDTEEAVLLSWRELAAVLDTGVRDVRGLAVHGGDGLPSRIETGFEVARRLGVGGAGGMGRRLIRDGRSEGGGVGGAAGVSLTGFDGTALCVGLQKTTRKVRRSVRAVRKCAWEHAVVLTSSAEQPEGRSKETFRQGFCPRANARGVNTTATQRAVSVRRL